MVHQDVPGSESGSRYLAVELHGRVETAAEETAAREMRDYAELSTFGGYVRRIHTERAHKGKKGASFTAASASWLNLWPPLIKHRSLKTIKLLNGWKTTTYRRSR